MLGVAETISREDATAIARVEVERLGRGAFALLDSATAEVDVGWVFFFQSARNVETGNERDALAGNGPMLVDRRDGSLHHCWSGEPWDAAVDRYRETGRTLPPSLGGADT